MKDKKEMRKREKNSIFAMLLIKLIIILKVFHHLLELIQAKGKNRKRKKVYYKIKMYIKLEQNSDCHFFCIYV